MKQTFVGMLMTLRHAGNKPHRVGVQYGRVVSGSQSRPVNKEALASMRYLTTP
jgi:hypothetical protein